MKQGFWRNIKRVWYKMQFRDSLMEGMIYGKFRAKYKDGQVSIKMYYKTAKNYADIFGGEVIDAF